MLASSRVDIFTAALQSATVTTASVVAAVCRFGIADELSSLALAWLDARCASGRLDASALGHMSITWARLAMRVHALRAAGCENGGALATVLAQKVPGLAAKFAAAAAAAPAVGRRAATAPRTDDRMAVDEWDIAECTCELLVGTSAGADMRRAKLGVLHRAALSTPPLTPPSACPFRCTATIPEPSDRRGANLAIGVRSVGGCRPRLRAAHRAVARQRVGCCHVASRVGGSAGGSAGNRAPAHAAECDGAGRSERGCTSKAGSCRLPHVSFDALRCAILRGRDPLQALRHVPCPAPLLASACLVRLLRRCHGLTYGHCLHSADR